MGYCSSDIRGKAQLVVLTDLVFNVMVLLALLISLYLFIELALMEQSKWSFLNVCFLYLLLALPFALGLSASGRLYHVAFQVQTTGDIQSEFMVWIAVNIVQIIAFSVTLFIIDGAVFGVVLAVAKVCGIMVVREFRNKLLAEVRLSEVRPVDLRNTDCFVEIVPMHRNDSLLTKTSDAPPSYEEVFGV